MGTYGYTYVYSLTQVDTWWRQTNKFYGVQCGWEIQNVEFLEFVHACTTLTLPAYIGPCTSNSRYRLVKSLQHTHLADDSSI
jgi:hypothetical protein